MKPYLLITLALLTSCAKSKEEKPVPITPPTVSTMDITFKGQRYELRDTLENKKNGLYVMVTGVHDLHFSVYRSAFIMQALFYKSDTGNLGTWRNANFRVQDEKGNRHYALDSNSITVTAEDAKKIEGHLSFSVHLEDGSGIFPFEGVFNIYKPKE